MVSCMILMSIVCGTLLPVFFIVCSVRWIPSVTVLDLDLMPLEDGEIVLLIEATERYPHYATCFSSEEAA